MPPMFCTARHCSACRNSSQSASAVSGAPWPPAATSRGRKLLMVVMPLRSTMMAASVSCSVAVTSPRVLTACQKFCPCEPIRSTSLASRPASSISASAASAKSSPSSKCNFARSSVLPLRVPASRMRGCMSGGKGCVRVARSCTSSLGGAPLISHSAASIASAEVPEMRPITSMGNPVIVRRPQALLPLTHSGEGGRSRQVSTSISPANSLLRNVLRPISLRAPVTGLPPRAGRRNKCAGI